MHNSYYLGLDVGSSSVKVGLVDAGTGKTIAVCSEPDTEMTIKAVKLGWGEQDPESWWKHACNAIKRILSKNKIGPADVKGIGISYQMHGLVLVDKEGKVVRDSIIWCDSRAVEIGKNAFAEMGEGFCAEHFLNSPANFTASKLKWVKENEPGHYKKIHKMMLPGDFIAYKLSGVINTTRSGLSEGILWDFKENDIANSLLEHYGIDASLIPDIVGTFEKQSKLSKDGAAACGLKAGTPILYRAGDQPNNALSLNILKPGEVAATGGTSGVMYAVTDELKTKETSRINSFAHVNHTENEPRIGKLLNINGAGILYRWMKDLLGIASYGKMNDYAEDAPIGSGGAVIIPFGNGAERMLENEMPGMHLAHVNFNMHDRRHICRAALEGIAFAFVYGMEILMGDGKAIKVIRAGNDNLFRSGLFSATIATLVGREIEIYNTTGAVGAARAAGLTNKAFPDMDAVLGDTDHITTFKPHADKAEYQKAYQRWKKELNLILNA